MSRGLLHRLSDPTLVALVVAGGEWPRPLLSNTLIPDAWMGLVERRDGRRRFVPAGEDPRPDDDDVLLLIRNRLITVPLDVTGCKASCGNVVDATSELLLRWSARDDDLAALRRSSLFRSEPAPQPRGGARPFSPTPTVLTLDRLAQTVNESGARLALQRFVRETPAARLMTDDVRDDFRAALRNSLAKFLFEIGASIEQVAKLHFSSKTLAAQQELERDAEQRVQRIKARELVEQAAIEATQKRLGELSGVFDKLKTAAAGNDRMQWHDLLPSLSPAERGQLLENLWRITPDAKKTRAIVVVAGNEIVWLDPVRPDLISHRVKLPDELGGLRSVTYSGDALLVGAARGIWALHAESGEIRLRCAAAGAPPGHVPNTALPSIGVPTAARGSTLTGFNSAAITATHLYATHSQLGCWRWFMANAVDGSPAGSEAILVPQHGSPKTVRAVAPAADGQVYFAADDCVHSYNPASGLLSVVASADDTIHCMTVLDQNLFVGTADGKLLRLDLRQPDDWWVPFRTNAPIESIQARRWNDLVELVVPAGSQGIVGVYAEQNVVSRLLESTTPIRRAWASDDMLVGLNDRRDRLVVMNSNAPDRMGREIALARVLGSSIQDACLVTATAAAPAG